MHGNVAEKCLDWYGALTFGTDPKGPSSGSSRVICGCGWQHHAYELSSSFHQSLLPSSAYGDGGIRLVLPPQIASAHLETQTTPASVPYVWLRTYYPATPDEYDFYEAAAKETAANGVNKVWECFVAGLVPTNATDVFRAVISMENGVPVVGWEPDLNEGGTKHERVYMVEGKETITDSWAPTNSASRFFRVKVSMP